MREPAQKCEKCYFMQKYTLELVIAFKNGYSYYFSSVVDVIKLFLEEI